MQQRALHSGRTHDRSHLSADHLFDLLGAALVQRLANARNDTEAVLQRCGYLLPDKLRHNNVRIRQRGDTKSRFC